MKGADPYVYPGTTVLRNKKNLRTQDALDRYERLKVGNRMQHAPLDFPVSENGYQAIHRYLFQDVYEWAGQPRTIAIAKGGMFALPGYIDQELTNRFRLIRQEDGLKALAPARFSERAAEHICELNAIHPFRDGNGRVQRFFLKVLAHQAGHDLRIDKLDQDLWMRASVESFQHQDYKSMTTCIRGALTERSRSRSRSRSSDRSRER